MCVHSHSPAQYSSRHKIRERRETRRVAIRVRIQLNDRVIGQDCGDGWRASLRRRIKLPEKVACEWWCSWCCAACQEHMEDDSIDAIASSVYHHHRQASPFLEIAVTVTVGYFATFSVLRRRMLMI